MSRGRPARRPPAGCIATSATARSRTSPRASVSIASAGPRASARATTTTTAGSISSSPTSGTTCSIAIAAAAVRRRDAAAGLEREATRWGSGCSFLDYDRDGDLDLFVANYLRFDLATAPEPGQGANCLWKGVPVNCGPKGLPTDTNLLYRNNGNGTFADVSVASRIASVTGRYPMTAIAADLDDDGWTDIYVASDSTAAILYRNNRDGTFTDVALQSGTALQRAGQPAGRDGRSPSATSTATAGSTC